MASFTSALVTVKVTTSPPQMSVPGVISVREIAIASVSVLLLLTCIGILLSIKVKTDKHAKGRRRIVVANRGSETLTYEDYAPQQGSALRGVPSSISYVDVNFKGGQRVGGQFSQGQIPMQYSMRGASGQQFAAHDAVPMPADPHLQYSIRGASGQQFAAHDAVPMPADPRPGGMVRNGVIQNGSTFVEPDSSYIPTHPGVGFDDRRTDGAYSNPLDTRVQAHFNNNHHTNTTDNSRRAVLRAGSLRHPRQVVQPALGRAGSLQSLRQHAPAAAAVATPVGLASLAPPVPNYNPPPTMSDNDHSSNNSSTPTVQGSPITPNSNINSNNVNAAAATHSYSNFSAVNLGHGLEAGDLVDDDEWATHGQKNGLPGDAWGSVNNIGEYVAYNADTDFDCGQTNTDDMDAWEAGSAGARQSPPVSKCVSSYAAEAPVTRARRDSRAGRLFRQFTGSQLSIGEPEYGTASMGSAADIRPQPTYDSFAAMSNNASSGSTAHKPTGRRASLVTRHWETLQRSVLGAGSQGTQPPPEVSDRWAPSGAAVAADDPAATYSSVKKAKRRLSNPFKLGWGRRASQDSSSWANPAASYSKPHAFTNDISPAVQRDQPCLPGGGGADDPAALGRNLKQTNPFYAITRSPAAPTADGESVAEDVGEVFRL